MLYLLLSLIFFTPSPSPGALHDCTAYTREMVDCACFNEETQAWETCQCMGPPTFVECSISIGDPEYHMETVDVALGSVLAFCISAVDPLDADRRSLCGEPVLDARFAP